MVGEIRASKAEPHTSNEIKANCIPNPNPNPNSNPKPHLDVLHEKRTRLGKPKTWCCAEDSHLTQFSSPG